MAAQFADRCFDFNGFAQTKHFECSVWCRCTGSAKHFTTCSQTLVTALRPLGHSPKRPHRVHHRNSLERQQHHLSHCQIFTLSNLQLHLNPPEIAIQTVDLVSNSNYFICQPFRRPPVSMTRYCSNFLEGRHDLTSRGRLLPCCPARRLHGCPRQAA